MSDRATQAARILELLRSREGSWVPLPEILRLGIAQYNARIFELRRGLWNQGWEIELRDERVNGQRHTAYRLVRRDAQQFLEFLDLDRELRPCVLRLEAGSE